MTVDSMTFSLPHTRITNVRMSTLLLSTKPKFSPSSSNHRFIALPFIEFYASICFVAFAVVISFYGTLAHRNKFLNVFPFIVTSNIILEHTPFAKISRCSKFYTFTKGNVYWQSQFSNRNSWKKFLQTKLFDWKR